MNQQQMILENINKFFLKVNKREKVNIFSMIKNIPLVMKKLNFFRSSFSLLCYLKIKKNIASSYNLVEQVERGQVNACTCTTIELIYR